MKIIKLIQSLSFQQWRVVWSAYWRIWPIVLRIKFKQFFKDTGWLTRKVSLVGQSGLTDLQLPSNIERNDRQLQEPQLRDQKPQLSTKTKNAQRDRAIELHELVRLAARLHFSPARCLPRSIVLVDLLRLRRIDARTIIGVSKINGRLASHAWVEVDGVAISEPESLGVDFTALKA